MMGKRIVRIGIDFDGVLAYNPFRVIRAPVTFVKRKILGETKTRFYIPKTPVERFVWAVLHESSVFPAKGVGLLRSIAKRDDTEIYLVTARFAYLTPNLNAWLDRYDLKKIFDGIRVNEQDRQPHVHKLDQVNRLKLDYFIEDNWDIVSHLQGKTDARVLWIYNILDRGVPYAHKHPYLEEALRAIVREQGLT